MSTNLKVKLEQPRLPAETSLPSLHGGSKTLGMLPVPFRAVTSQSLRLFVHPEKPFPFLLT